MTLHPDRKPAPSDASAESGDPAWIDAVRAGDVAAFEAMFRAHADGLCGFVYGYLDSRDEAQELVQDLFLWIWDHREDWQVAGTLKSYLYKAARNRALSAMRHKRVELRFQRHSRDDPARGLEPPSSPPADQELHAAELAGAIESAIADLPSRCREVFELNRRHHLSYAEIADLLQISVRTVEVHMGRALAALRRRLADWTGAE